MKKLLFALILLASCTKTIYVPTIEYIKGKDSIRIEKKDSIIYIDSPVQLQNVITNQKSCLSTDYSFSLAWVDTVGLLHHSIQNNPKIPLKTSETTVYKENIKEHTKKITILKTVTVTKEHTPLKAWGGWILLAFVVLCKIRKFFGIPI